MDALMSSDGVHDAMTEGAEAALEHAQSIAPVLTGDYRNLFRVESSDGSGEAYALLVNDDPGAAAIEWGNDKGSRGHHTLTQTGDWIEKGGN